MARITFANDSDFAFRLKKLEQMAADKEAIEEAVAKGAAVVADAIRHNLEQLPTDQYRKLSPGEKFTGLSKEQKEDLLEGFGLTKIDRDRNGFVHTKAGFDGYGRFPTEAYPKGLPNQLLARATESGSSVREKTPFVRTAVRSSKKKAVSVMDQSIDESIKKIF